MKLYVFDDAAADRWHPFSLTRPIGELLYGALLLRERLERFAGRRAAASLTRDWLAGYREAGAPPALPRGAGLPGAEPRAFLSARAVPADGARLAADGGRPVALRVAGEVAGCVLPPDAPSPGAEWIADPGPLRRAAEEEVEGEWLEGPWSLVAGNSRRLASDLLEAPGPRAGPATRRAPDDEAPAGPAASPLLLPRGVDRIGDAPLWLGERTRLEPGVFLDLREGGIRLDDAVEVRAGTRLAGPLWAGRGTRLLGGSLSSLSAGPHCRLRGEIEESVVLGWSNKAHDGFLGHSVVGRWVNLGALTTSSDLKNNYGPVRLGGPQGEVETGLRKLGCLIGDHAKTAIGTLLGAGTVVGAGANLFGTGMPPKWVPPFAWGGRDGETWRRDDFLATAAVVMQRRSVACDEGVRRWLADVWEAGVR